MPADLFCHAFLHQLPGEAPLGQRAIGKRHFDARTKARPTLGRMNERAKMLRRLNVT